MKKGFLISLFLFLSGCATSHAQYQRGVSCTEQSGITFNTCPKVIRFIDNNLLNIGYSRNQLLGYFSHTEFDERPMKTMDRPIESLPWEKYHSLFLTQTRIEHGIAFYHRHATTLKSVAQQYQVDPYIIVATLGAETDYGTTKGSYHTLNTLANLTFNYPRRADFYQGQLKDFFRFTYQNKLNPTTIQGSYGGAMGQLQFMPDSALKYAVKYEGTGNVDLMQNENDVIASIANFYHLKGQWNPQEKIVAAEVKNGVVPTCQRASGKSYAGKQITFDKGRQTWVTCDNFDAIMRYNPDSKYAMAIYQLSEKIHAGLGKTAKNRLKKEKAGVALKKTTSPSLP